MDHALQATFLEDLTIAVVGAAVAYIICSRLKVHPILGFLAVGLAIGPFTPGYVAHTETIGVLATIGLIFLLFSIGLEFSIDEIAHLGTFALVGGVIVFVVIAALGFVGALALGMPHPFTVAMTVGVSSTAVGVALLEALGQQRSAAGSFAVSQLVVQDLIAVALLVLVTTPADRITPAGVIVPVVKAIAFVALALLFGHFVLQPFVRRTIARASAESMFVVFAGVALLAGFLGELVGLGYEFGAFIAGAVISEAAGSHVVASIVAPFRALFVALFFVSIGMLFDPKAMLGIWWLVIILGIVFSLLRAGLWAGLARLARLPLAATLVVGVAMTALGEFNAVLVQGGLAAHRLSGREAQLLLAITITSIVIAVLAGPQAARVRHLQQVFPPPEGGAGEEPEIIVIGLGRVGRTVCAVLRAAGIPFTALEEHRDVVEATRAEGYTVVYGNAADPFALDRALTPTTRIALIALRAPATTAAVTERLAARGLQVIARATQADEVDDLLARGAERAIVPETEGALAFGRVVLRAYGLDLPEVAAILEAQRVRLREVLDPV